MDKHTHSIPEQSHQLSRTTRSFCADDALNLTPLRKMTLEDALEYIGEDELLDVTPESIRLRKKVLGPGLRT
jgi:GTP-binding protein